MKNNIYLEKKIPRLYNRKHILSSFFWQYQRKNTPKIFQKKSFMCQMICGKNRKNVENITILFRSIRKYTKKQSKMIFNQNDFSSRF